jgi:Flp pilus assembly pilin Flp
VQCVGVRTANLPFYDFSRKTSGSGIADLLATNSIGCGAFASKMSWWGRFLRLWRDSAGSSLIEYSFVITIMIALVMIAVATAGVWVAETWAHLLSTLSP